MKIGMEFVVVVAEAVQIVMRQHLNHRAPPPPPVLRQGLLPYTASYPSPFLFGFLP
ncbi:unnamed protein product [Arabidopsis thaliana]|nr:unnamed protein product [Arabidopsis thaliana]